MRVEQRPAVEQDRGFLEDVHVAALGPLALVGYGWPAVTLLEQFRSEIELVTCRVILVDGLRAGYFAVEDRGDYWYLSAIAIGRKHQRKGIGTLVMRELLATAGRPVRLNVLHVNPARDLYVRLGFRTIARDDRRRVMEWRAPLP